MLDETTYYFTAFAIDQNNNIIDSETLSITTDFWWHVTPNTLFYFEFEQNLNDLSWNGNNPTASRSVWYESVGWQYVIRNTASNPYIRLNPSVWNNISDFTVAFWIYPVKPSNWYYPMLFGSYNNSDPYAWPTIFYNDNNNNRIIARMSRNNEHYPFSLIPWQWQHIAFTRINWQCKVYLNWELKETFTDNTSWNAQTFYIFSRIDANQFFNQTGAKWDKYIYEKIWWTDNEVARYVNKTKSIFWL